MDDPGKTYRVGEELSPRALFLSLAEYHGLRPEVASLLREIGDLRPDRFGKGLAPLLTDARKRHGLTILQVFERSGISRSQLSFYENGHQKNPGLRTIQALSYGYRIPFALVLIATLNDIRPRANIRRRRRQ